ncbi:MAG: MucBP domain-containing protein [Schleiferilactobacillus perolens]|uniref:MucBP domain-containing protein n=1 Tax=Schleiferilactobacillus perolens TaxID=100468 RepID=UPI0039E99CDE
MVQGRKFFRTHHWLVGGLLLLGMLMTLLVTTPVHAAVNGAKLFHPIAKVLPMPVKDATVANEDIDTWMPDKNMQLLTFYSLQDNGVDVKSIADITKDDMKKITSFDSSHFSRQQTNPAYYQAAINVQSLKGLEYATNLTSIDVSPDPSVEDPYTQGKLSDISALQNLTGLTSVIFQHNRIADISSLANKPQLDFAELGYNQITDVSALAGSPSLTWGTRVFFQYIKRPTLTFNPSTTEFVTPAYELKGKIGNTVPVKAYSSTDTTIPESFRDNFDAYNSTATGTNMNDSTIKWTNLSGNLAPGKTGYFTAYWNDLAGSGANRFFGIVYTPYVLDDTIGNVFVNYETADGTPLHDQTVLAEKLGDSYDLTTDTTVKGIVDGIKAQGYIAKVTGDEKGTFAKEGTTVTYVFTKTPAQVKVPVHYLDADKKTIAGQTDGELSGVPTDKLSAADWATAQRTIDGYTYSHAEVDGKTVDPTTLTYADLSTGLNMIYTKNAPVEKNGTVIANYVDENGHPLSNAVTQTGKVGDPYATEQLVINGYTFKQMAAGSAPVKGQYIDGTLTVTYVYAPNTPAEQYGTVITRFVDSTGTVIRDQVSTTGKVGTSYTTSPVTVSGYTYLRVASGSAQPSGQYINGTLTVTYVYQKNTPPVTQYGTVIAQYVDDQGNTIRTAITTSGLVGTNYTTGQLTIPGYTFKQVASGSAATSGLYVNGTLTVTYVYTKDTAPIPETSKVIARYVDENGTAIHDEIVTTGKVGDPYSTDQLLIKGYTYQQLAAGSAPIYGVYTKDTQIVTYVYSKIDTGGETPGTGDDGDKTPGTGGESGDKQPTTPTKPGQGGGTTGGTTSPVETPTGNSEAARKGQLPQTDEDEGLTSMLLTILGVVLLGIAAVSYRKLRD